MTSTLESSRTSDEVLLDQQGHWIRHWQPDDPTFWNRIGKNVAFKNLCFSIFAEHIGFSVWLLWSIVVVQMTANSDGTAAASGPILTSRSLCCW